MWNSKSENLSLLSKSPSRNMHAYKCAITDDTNHPTMKLDTLSFVISLVTDTLRPRQNSRRFADDTLKRIFLNENVRISINLSLKFVPKGSINNIPA